MRDVEYLLAAAKGAASPLEGALIYRYRTGVLRPRMRAALCGLAPQKWRALFLKEEGSDGRPEANLYA